MSSHDPWHHHDGLTQGEAMCLAWKMLKPVLDDKARFAQTLNLNGTSVKENENKVNQFLCVCVDFFDLSPELLYTSADYLHRAEHSQGATGPKYVKVSGISTSNTRASTSVPPDTKPNAKDITSDVTGASSSKRKHTETADGDKPQTAQKGASAEIAHPDIKVSGRESVSGKKSIYSKKSVGKRSFFAPQIVGRPVIIDADM